MTRSELIKTLDRVKNTLLRAEAEGRQIDVREQVGLTRVQCSCP